MTEIIILHVIHVAIFTRLYWTSVERFDTESMPITFRTLCSSAKIIRKVQQIHGRLQTLQQWRSLILSHTVAIQKGFVSYKFHSLWTVSLQLFAEKHIVYWGASYRWTTKPFALYCRT